MLRLCKPSPAMVVACISLFVALGGVSTAAVVVLKKNSVLSKHIRNGQVKTPDLGANAVNSTKVGDGSLLAQDFAAGQLPAGPQGPQGPQGPPGSARAYAVVTNSATFNAARTSGFTSVSRPSTGIYCLTPAPGINPGTHPAIASPEWNNSSGTDLRVAVAASSAFSGCTSSQYEIVTLSGSPPVVANNVAFTVIVP